MKRRPPQDAEASAGMRRFEAEAAYADPIFRSAMGDSAGALEATRRAVEWDPTYAPAILTMGSIEYQLRKRAEGRRLFHSLLSLPESTPDLPEIIDKAGDFLIDLRAYRDGLALFRAAAKKFPAVATPHQGVSCCASHQGFNDEALEAAGRALELDPANQKLVNDLGWPLLRAGRHGQARRVLQRAVSMDPTDELARENLRLCEAEISRVGVGAASAVRPARRRRPSAGE